VQKVVIIWLYSTVHRFTCNKTVGLFWSAGEIISLLSHWQLTIIGLVTALKPWWSHLLVTRMTKM